MRLRRKIIAAGLALLTMLAIFITGTYAWPSTTTFEARNCCGTEQEQFMYFDAQDTHQLYPSDFGSIASSPQIAEYSANPQSCPITIPISIPCPSYMPQPTSPPIIIPCTPTPIPCTPTPIPCTPTPIPCTPTPIPCTPTPTCKPEIDWDEIDRENRIIAEEDARFLQEFLKDSTEGFQPCPEPWDCRDPLLIDLTGDGVQTTNIDNGVIFDIDADGNLEKTAWAAPGTGILVRDLNGNGRIDNAAELFGDNTILQSGWKAKHGFEALVELDLNNDGRIDQFEAEAAGLRIWTDDNVNGVADEGELLTLEEAGVLYINLYYTVSSDIDVNGNAHTLQSTYMRTDETSMSIVDVWLLYKKYQ